MHGGQLANLEDVVAHYVRSPKAATGHSELAHDGKGKRHAERKPIRLTDEDARDLVAFLRTLSGPLMEGGRPLEIPSHGVVFLPAN